MHENMHYKNITETDALRSALNRFIEGLYDRDKNGVFNWATRSRAGMARPIKMRRSNNVSDLAGIYFDLCDEYEVDFQFEKPLESIDDLSLRVRHAFYRVSAALSALTGVRWSELASLKNDAFEFSSTRGKFKSKIKKTNNNSETYRPVTIHAQPIAWISNGLSQQSAIHGDDTVAPWLLKATLPWQKQPVSINGLSWHDTGDNKSMGGFYRELLSELISDYDSEGIPISSHRFRHTWAELAIRRFDGNVPEAIRNYFRHWYGSFMTMDYIREKIKADLPEINRSYMRELVHRIAKNEQEFFGPAARYMLSLVQDIDVLEPTQVDELLNQFEMIKVHEHSYCMIPKQHKSQAKCWDKATKTPIYDDACWNNCGGCMGRFTLGNDGSAHKDAILRIGMTAQEMINTNKSQGLDNLNGYWRNQLKRAEAALRELSVQTELDDGTNKGSV